MNFLKNCQNCMAVSLAKKVFMQSLPQSLQLLWTHLKILKVQVQISHLCQKVLLLQTHPQRKKQASTSEGVKLASDVSVSADFQFERPQATESMANVSDNTASNLVITNVRSVDVMSSSEVSRSGGLSAEDLPPLELNKRLHVSIECYPNLLKRFQEGKVRIKKNT